MCGDVGGEGTEWVEAEAREEHGDWASATGWSGSVEGSPAWASCSQLHP